MVTRANVCTGKKKDGTKCTAPPLKDSHECWFHSTDPAIQKSRDRARLKGGEARVQQAGGRATIRKALGQKYLEETEFPELKLDSQERILTLLSITAKGLITGRLSPDLSSAIASIANVALRALKDDKTDDRLKKLEEQTRVLKDVAPETLLELLRKAREARGVAAGH